MFEIDRISESEISLAGHFDASQQEKASKIFEEIKTSHTVLFNELDYISSAGLSILLYTQQRLSEVGDALKLKGMNPHVKLVFEYAGFDQIFDIE